MEIIKKKWFAIGLALSSIIFVSFRVVEVVYIYYQRYYSNTLLIFSIIFTLVWWIFVIVFFIDLLRYFRKNK